MTEYGAFCPVSLATEVLSERWTPLVVRELILGNTRFNDIARGLPGISRSLLTQRLRHLERKGVIETWPSPTGRGNEYHLTPAGKDLAPVIDAMALWSIEWLYEDLHPGEVDAQTLMWWMHRLVEPTNFPPGRTIVEFEHTAPERKVIWLVLDRGEASVCLTYPGADADVAVSASTATLGEIFAGAQSWAHAAATGALVLSGPPKLVKAIPQWFAWSPFAAATRDRARRAS
jgi:DNA-binding HxlR family transcriptional regulator